MQTNSDKDFQDLRDKVNRVDQRMEETVLPTLEDIKKTLGKMAFVKQADYDKDMEAYLLWKQKVEGFMTDAKPSVRFFSALNSRWTQILIGGLIVGAIVAVGSQINKIGIF